MVINFKSMLAVVLIIGLIPSIVYWFLKSVYYFSIWRTSVKINKDRFSIVRNRCGFFFHLMLIILDLYFVIALISNDFTIIVLWAFIIALINKFLIVLTFNSKKDKDFE